jgi:hypothetical protein
VTGRRFDLSQKNSALESGDLPETFSEKYLRGKDNEFFKASALLFNLIAIPGED